LGNDFVSLIGLWVCVRQPDVQLGFLYGDWLTMGMILSSAMLVTGLSWIAYLLSKGKTA